MFECGYTGKHKDQPGLTGIRKAPPNIKKLEQALLKHGIFLESRNSDAFSKMITLGSGAVPILIKGLNHPESKEGTYVSTASVSLAIKIGKTDPQAVSMLIDALNRQKAPSGMILEILSNFPQEDVRTASRETLKRGLELRAEGEKSLLLYLTGSEDPNTSAYAASIRNAKIRLAHIANAPDAEAQRDIASRFCPILGTKSLPIPERIALMTNIIDRQAKGTALAKYAIGALSSIGTSADILLLMELLIHDSKELREAAMQAVLRLCAPFKDNTGAIKSISTCLLGILSRNGGRNYEAVLRTLKSKPFSTFLTSNPAEFANSIISNQRIDETIRTALLRFVFANSQPLRDLIFESLKMQDRILDSLLDTYLVILEGMHDYKLPPSEYRQIYEVLFEKIKDKSVTSEVKSKIIKIFNYFPPSLVDGLKNFAYSDFTNRPGERIFDVDTTRQITGLYPNIATQNHHDTVILVIDNDWPFSEMLDAHIKTILRKLDIEGMAVIKVTDSESLPGILVTEKNKISCCIISEGFLSDIAPGKESWSEAITGLLKSKIRSSAIIAQTSPTDLRIRNRLATIEKDFGQKKLSSLGIRICCKDELLGEEYLLSLMSECNAFAFKNSFGIQPPDGILEYAGLPSVKKLLESAFPFGYIQLPFSGGMRFVAKEQIQPFSHSIFILEPTRMTPEIKIGGALSLTSANLGLVGNADFLGESRHGMRVTYGFENGITVRSSPISNSVNLEEHFKLNTNLTPCTICFSNRTTQGPIAVELAVYY